MVGNLGDFLRDPSTACVKSVQVYSANLVSWQPPCHGVLKFNVDASVRNGCANAGIGGLLRDWNGEVFVRFSKAVHVVDPVRAELLAVKEALLIFFASRWANTADLVVETDCSNVEKWMYQPASAPDVYKSLLMQIRMLGSGSRWSVKHVRRNANSAADALAKAGVGRVVDLLVI